MPTGAPASLGGLLELSRLSVNQVLCTSNLLGVGQLWADQGCVCKHDDQVHWQDWVHCHAGVAVFAILPIPLCIPFRCGRNASKCLHGGMFSLVCCSWHLWRVPQHANKLQKLSRAGLVVVQAGLLFIGTLFCGACSHSDAVHCPLRC